MRYKEYTVSSGKKVRVYDDIIPLLLREKIYSFIVNSHFKLGWLDSITEKGSQHKYLHSFYNEQDSIQCGLLPYLMENDSVAAHLKSLKITHSVINLSVPSDTHFAHSHGEKLVVLYYANLEWQQHWHGETLFYSEDLGEIELALPYTPGRVVIFDADIPHSMRPQSISADHYRFTYATVFDEVKDGAS